MLLGDCNQRVEDFFPCNRLPTTATKTDNCCSLEAALFYI